MHKSIFIVLYMTLAIIATISGIRELVSGGMWWAPASMLLVSAPVAVLLVRLMALKDKARTDPNLRHASVLAVAGSVLVLYAWYAQQVSFVSFVQVIGMAVLFGLYVYWYSKLDRSVSKIVIGKHLPEFDLTEVNGSTVSSKSLVSSPTVLIFYRGNWCPLCVAQVKEMTARYNELKALGVRVIFVSPQPQNYTKSLAKKFAADGLEFMQDAGNEAAKTLGIDARFGTPMGMQAFGYDSHTVLPTVIITDASGLVIWTDETDNYRVRPDPETYLKVLKEAGIKAT